MATKITASTKVKGIVYVIESESANPFTAAENVILAMQKLLPKRR